MDRTRRMVRGWRCRPAVVVAAGVAAMGVLGAEALAAGQSLPEIRDALAGPPDAEALSAFLRDAGVDPAELSWRDDDAAEVRVETWARLTDVDRDGVPDAFLALHDGLNVHWVLLRGEGPGALGDPVFLASNRFEGVTVYAFDLMVPRFCPRGEVCSGRVFVQHAKAPEPIHETLPERRVVYELVGDRLRPVLFHATDGGSGGWHRGWQTKSWLLLSTETPGEVLFVHDPRHAVGRAWNQMVVWRLEPGARRVGPPSHLSEPRLEQLQAEHRERSKPTRIDEPTHPEVVAFELAGDRRAVMTSDVWERIGVDPASSGLFGLGAGVDGLVHTAAFYEDVDGDVHPEAWVVLELEGWYSWILMDRLDADEWTGVAMVGPLVTDDRSPPFEVEPLTPETHRIGGRSLIVVNTGASGRWWSNVRSGVFLFERGELFPLWSGETDGHGARLQFLEVDGGAVRLDVITPDIDPELGSFAMRGWQRESWLLDPGATSLRRSEQ